MILWILLPSRLQLKALLSLQVPISLRLLILRESTLYLGALKGKSLILKPLTLATSNGPTLELKTPLLISHRENICPSLTLSQRRTAPTTECLFQLIALVQVSSLSLVANSESSIKTMNMKESLENKLLMCL